MRFPIVIYLFAFFGAAATSVLSLPLWRKVCRRAGIVDDPGERKIHHEQMPLAGGLAVFTGIALPIVFGGIILLFAPAIPFLDPSARPLLEHGWHKRALEVFALLGGGLIALLLGLWDDRSELRPGPKFLAQLFIALLVAASGVRITLFVANPVFSYAVTVLWILTLMNACNFMDNMNGLCAGIGAIGAAFFGTFAALDGQYLVGTIAFLALGALVGFLPYNFPRARAFLGDSGSHLVGFLLGVLAILPHFYNPKHRQRLAVLIPLLVLAVPLVDLATVVIIRTRLGKPFYIGDTNHLSHQLLRRGFSKPTAVLVLWSAAAAAGVLALLLRTALG